MDYVVVVLFEKTRLWLGGYPMTPTSGYRCDDYNLEVGGSDKSYHLSGRAIDFYHPVYSPIEIYRKLELEIPHQFGVGTYPDSNFTHIDSGPYRRWRE